jgi:AraC-like DNA-binding protein
MEVRRLQTEIPDANVLELAFDAGFESASTFYRAYKKQFGEAPRQKT